MTSEQNRLWSDDVRRPMTSRARETSPSPSQSKRAGLAAETVGLGEAREQLEVHFLREPAEGAVADLVAAP